MSQKWSQTLPATHFRVARPTDRFQEVIRFYEEGVGLTRLAFFEGHAGYTGVVYGLPSVHYQLEFTTHEEGSPCPAPTRDNLLVFYFETAHERDLVANRIKGLGASPVSSENPYWAEQGVTFEDPDGWRVTLMLRS